MTASPSLSPLGEAALDYARRGWPVFPCNPRNKRPLGQAFSLVHAGRRYLHFVAAETIVGADGLMTVPIFPMLRVIPDDGDVCEFARPMIQGSLSGNQVKWSRQTAPWTDLGTITITEDE